MDVYRSRARSCKSSPSGRPAGQRRLDSRIYCVQCTVGAPWGLVRAAPWGDAGWREAERPLDAPGTGSRSSRRQCPQESSKPGSNSVSTHVQSLLSTSLLPPARPAETNARSHPQPETGVEVNTVNLMYCWRRRPNVLTGHILITRREKSILQITLLSLALQELFIPKEPQCVYQFHSPQSGMKRCTDELGGNFPSPSFKRRVGKKVYTLDSIQIIDSGWWLWSLRTDTLHVW